MARSLLTAALLLAAVAAAAAQIPITADLLAREEIVPDVVDTVALDDKLIFNIAFPSGNVDAGNFFSINASMSQPAVTTSCKPGRCTVPRRTYYTLIMADPDAPTRENPIRRNIWHYGVTNIPNGRVSQGTTITTYRGPMPPMGTHRYTLLLFRQNGQISAPATPDDARAGFSVKDFAARYNLGAPVAVNWFTSAPDAESG